MMSHFYFGAETMPVSSVTVTPAHHRHRRSESAQQANGPFRGYEDAEIEHIEHAMAKLSSKEAQPGTETAPKKDEFQKSTQKEPPYFKRDKFKQDPLLLSRVLYQMANYPSARYGNLSRNLGRQVSPEELHEIGQSLAFSAYLNKGMKGKGRWDDVPKPPLVIRFSEPRRSSQVKDEQVDDA